MERLFTSTVVLLIGCQLISSVQSEDLDLEQFAADIFGDRSAAEHLKKMPQNSVGEFSAESCKDYSTSCAKYTSYCEHGVVQRFCKVTCKKCSNQPDIPKIVMPCEDNKLSMCALRKQYGMCETYETQMKQFCPKTCGFCEPEDDCNDLRDISYCNEIKRQGYCTLPNTIKLASIQCKKTCKLCAKDLKCGVVKAASLNQTSTVIAGVSAKKGYWPWQVAIYYQEKFICGGSLLDLNTVLSAAHCFYLLTQDINDYKVVLGEHNREFSEGTEQIRKVIKLVIHENYHDEIYNDIALLKISPDVLPTDFVVPICLPEKNSEVKADSKCFFTGWGKVTNPGNSVSTLQQAEVSVINAAECRVKNNRKSTQVTDEMVCAGDRGTFKGGCHGDSGGPLACETNQGTWELRGVMSWGSSDCNALEKYTVFTKVSRYIDWIKQHV